MWLQKSLLVPLEMEKDSVMDGYFSDITVHRVESEEERDGERLTKKPMLGKDDYTLETVYL